MRILFLSHYFPPEVNAPAVRTHEHCREWVQCGHEVHVLTCVPNHPQGRIYDGYKRRFATQHETVDGIQVHRVCTYTSPNKGFLRRTLGYASYMFAASLASLRLPRPDVLVATSPQFFCACAGFLASKLLRRPWIFELRDIWPESLVAVGAIRNKAIMQFLERIELLLYEDADAVVALTDSFKQNLLSRGVLGSKIHVVTNGIYPRSWRTRDQSSRNELGLDSKFIVSYVGTHGMAHNLETILEAASLLQGDRDIQFITVGTGAEYEKLLNIKKEKSLDNVSMVGQVPRERAKMYLEASDVSVVILRKAELFKTVIPSKMFEAMALRNPIILAVEGEAKRIVEEARAGLCIEPENAEQLAEAVLRLKSDGELRSRLGRNGLLAVEKKFNREVLARGMLEVIEGCAA